MTREHPDDQGGDGHGSGSRWQLKRLRFVKRAVQGTEERRDQPFEPERALELLGKRLGRRRSKLGC